ncbi:glycosyltransferase [Microbacterium bovistercoris]|uniref:Glycosyltransferase n=1 Tax=Microbacterium bovistercoris TaxID=2293570 RepID=A0A371NVY5_9MICO|nr:nucleotide disphospho-sugar-binding domain-containing protein [Microbacterium bovistercoris]REJ05970.1 glycosyltransferase [Microbacterium bovistercoris]
MTERLSVLVAAHVADGHMAPTLAIARHLADQGHRVRFLTGERFAPVVRAAGIEYLPWPADGQVDHQALRADAGGMAAMAANVERLFIAPAAGQYRALVEAIDAEQTDVVVTEYTVVGAACLTWGAMPHPPVVVCGILPLGLSSRDTAPWGMGILPRTGEVARLRNRALNWLTQHVVLRRPQRLAVETIREVAGGELTGFCFDWATRSALYAQLTVPGFEYPRSDLSPTVRFVGPLFGPPTRATAVPSWWGDLEGRTVVLVSQGTVANELSELVEPTVRALADRDLIVVATTGGADVGTLGPLPANVRVADFVPYDLLMPQVDVFVSNGGYGGLHYALAHGVPLVVSGVTEDKAETTRRVEWSGTGVNLGVQRPTSAAVGDAVDRVLSTPSFRIRAEELQTEIAASPGIDGLAEMISEIARTHRHRPESVVGE